MINPSTDQTDRPDPRLDPLDPLDPTDPAFNHAIDPGRRAAIRLGLIAGAGLFLGGCASAGSRVSGSTPGVKWPIGRSHAGDGPKKTAGADDSWKNPEPWRGPTPAPDLPRGVNPRSSWAQGAPIPARMDRMLPVRRITIHHDGMAPVQLTSSADVKQRLDLIRRSHLTRNFGDIGYHFIVDPMGGIWQGRPLTWQGAHVAHQNEHNLGIMCLGNFEIQRPTSAQLAALDRFVALQMHNYRVGVHQIKTHRELASTDCPGRNLQPHMNQARAGALALVS